MPHHSTLLEEADEAALPRSTTTLALLRNPSAVLDDGPERCNCLPCDVQPITNAIGMEGSSMGKFHASALLYGTDLLMLVINFMSIHSRMTVMRCSLWR